VSYDREFFVEEGRVARESAEIVLPWVLQDTEAKTVADFGCGVGAWLAVAKAHGCQVLGFDLHVPDDLLQIESGEFRRCELRDAWNPEGADLSLCLEVVEHLPTEDARIVVNELAASSKVVLFSAATPGQPGVGHINCQPHDYWHDLFADYSMEPEFIGDRFDEPVADFYRRNLFLYR
jgi:hypothetical protein